jgi:hypothetical protein
MVELPLEVSQTKFTGESRKISVPSDGSSWVTHHATGVNVVDSKHILLRERINTPVSVQGTVS